MSSVTEGINSCEAEGTPGGESPILPVIMLLIHPHCTWGNIPLVSMIYRKKNSSIAMDLL